MTDKTIKILEDLRKGNTYPNAQDIGAEEISDTLSSLKNLQVLNLKGNSYIVNNLSYLSKVIELKSVDKYINWVQKERLSKYQKIYLNLFIVFGIFGLLSNLLKDKLKRCIINCLVRVYGKINSQLHDEC